MLNYKLPAFAENGFVNCFDAAVMAVVTHSFDHYEWLLAMFWGFLFDKEGQSKQIWERFITGGLYRTKPNYYQELYHLKLEEQTFTGVEQGIDVIIYEIRSGVPVILSLDTYECPWNLGYQKIHCEHFVVLTDYMDYRREFMCHDLYHQIEKASLSSAVLYRMPAIRFFTAGRLRDHCVKYETIHELLHAVSTHYLLEGVGNNLFYFADALKNSDLFHQLEPADIQFVCLDPFFIRFQGFLSSRKNFLYFLKSQSSIVSPDLIDTMQTVCSQISNSFLLLLKYVHQNGNETIKRKACDLLMKTAGMEAAIAESIAGISY